MIRQELEIENIFKLIIRYKYYFIAAIIGSYIVTSIHVSNVNKFYRSFIHIIISPDYLSLYQDKRSFNDTVFNTYANFFKKEFFNENNLNNFFDDQSLLKISNIGFDKGVKFLKKNQNVEIKIHQDFFEIEINSNDIKLIEKLFDYSKSINSLQAKKIFNRDKYFEINIADVLYKFQENTNVNESYIELLNFKDYFDLYREKERDVRKKKYMIDNNLNIFKINYPTAPELIYPIKYKFFINYFLVFNIITLIVLIFYTSNKKNKKK